MCCFSLLICFFLCLCPIENQFWVSGKQQIVDSFIAVQFSCCYATISCGTAVLPTFTFTNELVGERFRILAKNELNDS